MNLHSPHQLQKSPRGIPTPRLQRACPGRALIMVRPARETWPVICQRRPPPAPGHHLPSKHQHEPVKCTVPETSNRLAQNPASRPSTSKHQRICGGIAAAREVEVTPLAPFEVDRRRTYNLQHAGPSQENAPGRREKRSLPPLSLPRDGNVPPPVRFENAPNLSGVGSASPPPRVPAPQSPPSRSRSEAS